MLRRSGKKKCELKEKGRLVKTIATRIFLSFGTKSLTQTHTHK